jgi:hypothetical protein
MNQIDSVLRMYAQSGLRTLEDWTALGRDIIGGATPRCDTAHRGAMVSLFSRDQTLVRVRVRPERI